jgi:hypothetical protein
MKGNGKTPPPPAASVTGWDDPRHVEVRHAPTTPGDHFDFHTSNLENEAQAREDRIRELTAEIRAMERARSRRWEMHPRRPPARNPALFFILACVLAALTVAGVAYVS